MGAGYTFQELKKIGTIVEEKKGNRMHIIKLKEPVKYFSSVWLFNKKGHLCGQKFVEISKKRYEFIIENIIGYSLEEIKKLGEIESCEKDDMLIIKLCGVERYFERKRKYDTKGEICEEKFFKTFKSRYEEIKELMLNYSLIELENMGTIEIVIESFFDDLFCTRIVRIKGTEQYFKNKWRHDSYGDPSYEEFIKISKEEAESFRKEMLDKYGIHDDKEGTWLKAIKRYDLALRCIPNNLKTEEFYKKAVADKGMLLEYVPDEKKTYEMCIIAVKNDGCALKYVPDEKKTYEMCIIAVKNIALAMKYIPESMKTDEIRYIVYRNEK